MQAATQQGGRTPVEAKQAGGTVEGWTQACTGHPAGGGSSRRWSYWDSGIGILGFQWQGADMNQDVDRASCHEGNTRKSKGRWSVFSSEPHSENYPPLEPLSYRQGQQIDLRSWI